MNGERDGEGGANDEGDAVREYGTFGSSASFVRDAAPGEAAASVAVYVARAVALVVVSDIAAWTVTLYGGGIPAAMRSLVIFGGMSVVYYGAYVARWNRSMFDLATRLVAAAAIGSSSVIFGTALALKVIPRPMMQVLAILLASTVAPLLGVYVEELRLHRTSTRRTRLMILSDCSLYGSWDAVAGTVAWACAFNQSADAFGPALAQSSFVAFIVAAACRWMRAMYVLYVIDHWIIQTVAAMSQEFTETVSRATVVVMEEVSRATIVVKETVSRVSVAIAETVTQTPDVVSHNDESPQPVAEPKMHERSDNNEAAVASVKMRVAREPQPVVMESAPSSDAAPVAGESVSVTQQPDERRIEYAPPYTAVIREQDPRPEPPRVVYAPAFVVVEEASTSSSTESDVTQPLESKRRRRQRKRQYRRRESLAKNTIDMSEIVSKEVNIALNMGVSIEAELQRMLDRRQSTLNDMKNQQANPISIAQVEADIAALRAELRRATTSREQFQRAQTSYESDLEMWMESIRAAAAVSRLDYAIDSLKNASVADDPQVKELIDQRAVWGLRLVSSQIFTIVELQDSLDSGEARSSARIAELRGAIESLELKLTRLQEEKTQSVDNRILLEDRLQKLNLEIDSVRERERVAQEDWQRERLRLEVELEASVKELQTATRTVDDALKAKLELLAKLQTAQDQSDTDAEAIRRLEHETETLQTKLKSLTEQLSVANASVEQINSRRFDLESQLRAKATELDLANANRADTSLVEELRRQVKNLSTEICWLRDQKSREGSEAEAVLQKQLAEARTQLEIQRNELEIEAKAEISELKRSMDVIREEMERLTSEMSEKTEKSLEYQRIVQERQKEIESLTKNKELAARAIDESKKNLAQAQEALETKQKALDDRVSQVASLSLDLAASEEKTLTLERELSASCQRSQELEELISSLRSYSESRDALLADIDLLLGNENDEREAMLRGSKNASDLVERIQKRLRREVVLEKKLDQAQLLEQVGLTVEELKTREAASLWWKDLVQIGSKALETIQSTAVDLSKGTVTASLLERSISLRAKELQNITSEPQYQRLQKSFNDLKRLSEAAERKLQEKERKIKSLKADSKESAAELKALTSELASVKEDLKYIRDIAKEERDEQIQRIESLMLEVDSFENAKFDGEEAVRFRNEAAKLRGMKIRLEAELKLSQDLAETASSELARAREEHDVVITQLSEEIAALELDITVKSEAIEKLESKTNNIEVKLGSDLESALAKLNTTLEELDKKSTDFASLESASVEQKRNFEKHVDELEKRLGASEAEVQRLIQDRDLAIEAKDNEMVSKILSQSAIVSDLESERDALRSQLADLSSARDSELASVRADLESQLREREEDIERVRSELDESKAALESERDALQSELERVMDDVLNAEALAEQAELIRSQMQADMEQLLEARQSVEQRLQDVDSALQISLNKVATLEIEQERLRLELSASEKALAESERARSESDAEILALSDELSDALNARLLIEQQLRARDEELETARIKQSELITENSKLRAELMDAKAMADDYTRQLSSGLFGDEKRVEAGIQRFDSFEASDTGIFATDEADEAFVTACNMVQRIEILVRRQKQTGEELKRLDDTGAAESDDARLLRSELAAMGSQLDSCRETLAACSHGLSVLESRMAEEFAAMGKSPMFAEGMDTTRSRVRDLEKSLAAANAQSDVTFKNLQIALDASTMDVGRDIPVEFKIPFQSIPGQRILVVGTWCDWITQNGLQLTWTEGNIWKGTMTLHTGSNYEYKYVVVEEVLGGVPGEAPPYFPPWGTTEPKIEQMFDGRAYMLVWQPGNNKAMALDNIHTDGVAQIKVSDDWIANPKKSPITLFAADGEVLEIVGSTALLGETVDRADHALAEARKQVQMMADLASAALAEVDTQLARRIATQLDDIRHKGTLSTDSDGKHHRGTKALPSSVEAGSPRSNLNWMNIGFGLEAQDDGEDSTSASTDAEDAGDGIDYA